MKLKPKTEIFEALVNVTIFTLFSACIANLAGTWVAGAAAFTGCQILFIHKNW